MSTRATGRPRISREEHRQRILETLASGPATLKALSAAIHLATETTRAILVEMDSDGSTVKGRGTSPHGKPVTVWRKAEASPRADRVKRRACITCGAEFVSQHPGNRMCARCRATAERDPLTPYDFSPC